MAKYKRTIDDLEYHIKFLTAGIKLRSKEEQDRDYKEIEEIKKEIKKMRRT